MAFTSTILLADTTIAKEIDERDDVYLVVRPVSDEINEDSAEELL